MSLPGMEPLSTTVVGSLPVSPSRDELIKTYKNGEDPYLDSIRECVKLQQGAGIDIISDGQTRNDMIRMYTTKLSGIRMRQRPVIINEIEHRGGITLDDQRFVRSIMKGPCLLKGIITGPHTLASSCVDEHYGSQEKLALAFAEALNKEARLLDRVVDMLQVDEPFFSVEFPEYAKEIVEIALAGVSKTTALHACGDVSQIFDRLVEMNVDVLDHEFAAHPELLDTVGDVDHDKIIGYGCIRSDIDSVEDVDTILERIKKGIDCIGHEALLLDPDCGLKHLSLDVALGKLENMVKARDVIRDEG